MAGQPGSWLSPGGIPVDLMVPDAIAGRGRRSVEAPPHDKRALRRAVGLEAAVVDNAVMTIRALAADEDRVVEARVAGPAALLVAKLYKLGERQETPDRLVDKDAYDAYRLLVAIATDELAAALVRLLADELAGDVTSVCAGLPRSAVRERRQHRLGHGGSRRGARRRPFRGRGSMRRPRRRPPGRSRSLTRDT
jgi:hypothetical protein